MPVQRIQWNCCCQKNVVADELRYYWLVSVAGWYTEGKDGSEPCTSVTPPQLNLMLWTTGSQCSAGATWLITYRQSQYQSSSCILYKLQWSNGWPWQTNQNRIAVIKTTQNEIRRRAASSRRYWHDVQLSEPSDVVEACADKFVDVRLHRQLAIQQNIEVANIHRLSRPSISDRLITSEVQPESQTISVLFQRRSAGDSKTLPFPKFRDARCKLV